MSWSDRVASAVNGAAAPVADALGAVVFYAIEVNGAEVPLIVLWLIAAGLFFTVYLGGINLRGLPHALRILRSQQERDAAAGELSAFQALSAAVSGTVGLGSIAGVSIAISVGGPGAAFWMVAAGLLGMATKFVECTLAVKYRVVHADGSVSGGPMYYLSRGLGQHGWPRLGRVLAIAVAVAFPFASLGLFQVQQSSAQFAHTTRIEAPLVFGAVMACCVGAVIVGGIRQIGRVAARLVPMMCSVYLGAGVVILIANADRLPDALALIVSEAFTGESAAGGVIGAMIAGVRRAVYSNEAGLGSSAVAHAAVRTDQPLTEGFVALLEPLIDSCIICLMTALIVIVTGAYEVKGVEGIVMTSLAFGSVIAWFPAVLTVSVILFAYSTIISWFYYGLKGFTYLVGDRPRIILAYKIAYCINLWLAAVIPLDRMIELADGMNFVLAIPNLIGLYLLGPEVRDDLRRYRQGRRENVAADVPAAMSD